MQPRVTACTPRAAVAGQALVADLARGGLRQPVGLEHRLGQVAEQEPAPAHREQRHHQ
ncbi:hypothetical protein [Nocardiopsis synnemataformans]|uniref:hypothetical protein n=1 Tax=Nocardiopsis synnemataformans TaxID=61305 RepID=UPI003EBA461F